jgi:hypothetical protein
VLPVARELGVGIVPYSPLGRGMLTGKVAVDSLDPRDTRKNVPRWQEGNLEQNLDQLQKFYQRADEKGCTPAQLALAWVHAQGVYPHRGFYGYSYALFCRARCIPYSGHQICVETTGKRWSSVSVTHT